MTDVSFANLSFQILIIGVAAIGAAAAWKRLYPGHCRLLAVAVVLNFVSVLLVMVPSFLVFAQALTLAGLRSQTVLLMITHGVLGTVSLGLAVLVVLRMSRVIRSLPGIKNMKRFMRTALLLWLLTMLLGVLIYRTFYG